MQNPTLPLRDQLVVMALKAYFTLMDDSETGCMNLAQLQMHTGILQPNLCFCDETRDAGWVTWVAMMFLACSHTDALTWSLGRRLLDQQKPKRTWMQRFQLCENYLWEMQFSYNILEKLYHQRQHPSMTGEKFSYISS